MVPVDFNADAVWLCRMSSVGRHAATAEAAVIQTKLKAMLMSDGINSWQTFHIPQKYY